MRSRTVLAAALLLAIPAPVNAEMEGPIEVGRGQEVGRSAATNGINGIYVSPYDGNLYAASVGGDEITVHDPTPARFSIASVQNAASTVPMMSS